MFIRGQEFRIDKLGSSSALLCSGLQLKLEKELLWCLPSTPPGGRGRELYVGQSQLELEDRGLASEISRGEVSSYFNVLLWFNILHSLSSPIKVKIGGLKCRKLIMFM